MATNEERVQEIEKTVVHMQNIVSTLANTADVAELSNQQTVVVAALTGSVELMRDEVRDAQDGLDVLFGQLSNLVPYSQAFIGPGAVTIVHNLGHLPIVQLSDQLGMLDDIPVQHQTVNRFQVTAPDCTGTIRYM